MDPESSQILAAILARWERIVLDLQVAVGWGIWAWANLLKAWGSLRWSDLQAMISGEIGYRPS